MKLVEPFDEESSSYTNISPLPYFFEVLPVHFKPIRLESLTSYLARLANANVISTYSDLRRTFFPTKPHKLLYEHFDFPLTNFGDISVATMCSKQTIQQTTFFHLLTKFSRSSSGAGAINFLKGSISEHLRFCPLCLQMENSHYSLCWRFNSLKGCIHHSCWLVEECFFCKQKNSLLLDPVNFSLCSNCRKDLKNCPTLPQSKRVQNQTFEQHSKLEFLLTPQKCEKFSSNILRSSGVQLRNFRKVRQESISQCAKRLGLDPKEVHFIESGITTTQGASLASYFTYLKDSPQSFIQIFT